MDLTIIFLIQIVFTLLICFKAAYTDLKEGIISNKLNLYLLIFGIISNLILTIFLHNLKYILSSIILIVITFSITFMLWKVNIWGGGDVKLFTAISASIPFGQNIPFLGIYPQLSFYPFSFTVIINSILVSFPFLIILTFYLNQKNKILKINKYAIFYLTNINNVLFFLKENFNKNISINNLKEGMIINNYYFNDYRIFKAINKVNGNLKVYESSKNPKYLFYFKSQTIGGINNRDIYLLKIMYSEKFISNKLSIKLGFPFAPSIAIGFLIGIFYGDLILILSNILKIIFQMI